MAKKNEPVLVLNLGTLRVYVGGRTPYLQPNEIWLDDYAWESLKVQALLEIMENPNSAALKRAADIDRQRKDSREIAALQDKLHRLSETLVAAQEALGAVKGEVFNDA